MLVLSEITSLEETRKGGDKETWLSLSLILWAIDLWYYLITKNKIGDSKSDC